MDQAASVSTVLILTLGERDGKSVGGRRADENEETEYVDETDEEEMQTEMYEDQEINNIMELVFGEDAEDDYTYMEQ